ncbi:MAG: protein kinase domain-containing protein, partial [Bacteroidota bacterium]
MIFQVLRAINHLHTCGIVHRDIKPDNFLFKSSDPNSPVKLIDFGLSRK